MMSEKTVLRIVSAILVELLPWLKEKAKESDNPIDDLAVRILETLIAGRI